jgi:molybdopterin molybdotransferase
MTTDPRGAGFRDQTRLADARDQLLSQAPQVERTSSCPIERADGRVLATSVEAARPVPHYPRAAMDGYAVRAEDTIGAAERSPVRLEVGEAVRPGTASRVHTGSELPASADAVVMVEYTERSGDEVLLTDAVAEGENVGPVGEDVAADAALFADGHRLGPADLGLLKATGYDAVEVYSRPEIAVIPTGEELVQTEPEAGEMVETNGLCVARYLERWGGQARYRDIVTDDRSAIREAITTDLDADAVVTTGGSSVGERDLVPAVIDDLGTVSVHGVALKPGHPVGMGTVEDTPVIALPGYPVSCIVNAVQFLRPLLKHVAHAPLPALPTRSATLTRKVASEPGVRTFLRVRIEDDGNQANTGGEDDADVRAVPVRASGAGVLSSVALADGWVEIPEQREGLDAGTQVEVADWEWSP